ETTRENEAKDWLKSNLARLSRLLQGQRNPATVGRLSLSELASLIGVQHGVMYLIEHGETVDRYSTAASYAAPERVDEAALAAGPFGQWATGPPRVTL